MAFMAAALPYISAAATIGTSIGNANAEQRVADIRAAQLKKQSIADKAEAVQTAKYERKKSEQLQSRVMALAASSGSAIESPDIQNALSDIDEQGEYNALAALYSGFSSANSKSYAADVETSSGKAAKASGYQSAAGTILDFAANKYA